MWLLLKRNARRQFKATLQGGARKAKVSGRAKNVDFQYNSRGTSKKAKSDNGENLSSSYSAVQLKESANSVNTLNIESISKSENSTKSTASSSETSSADENGRKLDMILSEISKLNFPKR